MCFSVSFDKYKNAIPNARWYDVFLVLFRHTRLLKEKEDSLMTCQQIYKTLQEELTAKERQEEDIKRRISLAENELEITKTLLNQTKEEVVTLKNESNSVRPGWYCCTAGGVKVPAKGSRTQKTLSIESSLMTPEEMMVQYFCKVYENLLHGKVPLAAGKDCRQAGSRMSSPKAGAQLAPSDTSDTAFINPGRLRYPPRFFHYISGHEISLSLRTGEPWELMLVSHQKSIEQLQETLRQKLLSDDNWREKIETELSKERARHLIEVEEKVLLFKEEAKLELDIEKERHQEIIQKYKKEQEQLQMKISDLIAGATRDLRLEVTALEEKLCESHIRHTEESESKEKQIENLKNLVAEYESRLKKEIDSNDSISENLRKETKQKSDELESVMLAQAQLIQQLNQTKEENTFLQETVRRECEERFELTEALGQAREQLLELRKLSGSLPLSPCALSKGSLTSPPAMTGSSRAEKSLPRLDSEKGTRIPSLCGGPKPTASPAPDNSTRVSPPGLPVLRQPYPPRSRASSVSQTRKRLAAILRRRLSQQ
ncbi:Leucine-, glutamate- and lysine-rich protein 1 [Tupaia chinensis]|uniref:Leucine-, glutamate-and lysine-rich protein 1 n=1 Tax=Tupaia chinensis TaxID=246437 RepID=L9KQG6_TUPCH|nr:Leucine-, glutamate- and lysine-rich protein 1 [Tupaia chinensis]